jgi:hypothetical protein
MKIYKYNISHGIRLVIDGIRLVIDFFAIYIAANILRNSVIHHGCWWNWAVLLFIWSVKYSIDYYFWVKERHRIMIYTNYYKKGKL